MESDGIVGQLGENKLQRNGAMQASVFGLIDRSHPATRQLFQDLIVRAGLTELWSRFHIRSTLTCSCGYVRSAQLQRRQQLKLSQPKHKQHSAQYFAIAQIAISIALGDRQQA